MFPPPIPGQKLRLHIIGLAEAFLVHNPIKVVRGHKTVHILCRDSSVFPTTSEPQPLRTNLAAHPLFSARVRSQSPESRPHGGATGQSPVRALLKLSSSQSVSQSGRTPVAIRGPVAPFPPAFTMYDAAADCRRVARATRLLRGLPHGSAQDEPLEPVDPLYPVCPRSAQKFLVWLRLYSDPGAGSLKV